MAYLLDTNVVSELRKRERCHPGVRQWFSSVNAEDLFLSVLVVGEIRRGIELVRQRDIVAARSLNRWLKGLEQLYEERILPVTLDICERWGKLSIDKPLAPIDGVLSATALHHELTLVTRNAGDVERSGDGLAVAICDDEHEAAPKAVAQPLEEIEIEILPAPVATLDRRQVEVVHLRKEFIGNFQADVGADLDATLPELSPLAANLVPAPKPEN